MSEDITANVRFSVALCLLAGLVSAVVSLATIGFTVTNQYVNRIDVATHLHGTNIIRDFAKMGEVSAPMLYRLLDEYDVDFYTIIVEDTSGNVVYKKAADGTITGNRAYLMRNGDFNYRINMQYINGQGYTISAAEVRLLTGEART